MKEQEIEAVAAECHKQWAGWTGYLLSKTVDDGEGRFLLLPKEWAERWRRQMDTNYPDLSEKEKNSDRAEARKILDALDHLKNKP